MPKNKKSPLMNMFKSAFAFGAGFTLSNMLISFVFLVIGFMMINKAEKMKKNEPESSSASTLKMVGMGLVVVGGGSIAFSMEDLDF